MSISGEEHQLEATHLISGGNLDFVKRLRLCTLPELFINLAVVNTKSAKFLSEHIHNQEVKEWTYPIPNQ